MTVRVRFAPSPTGLLHVGNARTALINWLFARKHGGRFLLRLDDTDAGRSREAYAEAIRRDLAWLGLAPDGEDRQSARLARYAEAAERLKAAGRLYPCYETPVELELRRKAMLQQGRPPIYDRAALRLDAAARARLEAEGRRPHWRFLLAAERVEWTDLVRGPVRFDGADLSDPVLVREDGVPLYTLASVVDDIDHATTHVIRGEDHVTNTATQMQLFRALAGGPPAFAHHGLLAGPDGAKLSKRLGDLSLERLREGGIEAMAAASLLARLGSADPVEPRASLDELVAGFDIGRLNSGPARFDPEELRLLNARVLHLLPFAAVAPRLAALGVGGGEAFWLAVRGNLARLEDAAGWWRICAGPLAPVVQPGPVAAAAADLLPAGEPTAADWGPWTKAIAARSGAKGRELYLPLRLALTGQEHGPELRNLLPLLGRRRVLARLKGETA